jgi:hypothetical protein
MDKYSNSKSSTNAPSGRQSEKEKEKAYHKSVNVLGVMYNQEKRDIERFVAFSKTLKGK